MHPMKTTSSVLAGLAVILLVLVQFLPWATFETSSSSEGGSFGGFDFPGFDFDFQAWAHTWGVEQEVNGQSSDEGWYDNDFDDTDGIGQIRTAIPMLLAATVVVFAGALLSATIKGAAGPITTLAGGVLLVIATVLFATGVNTAWDDVGFDWHVSFYFAITACLLVIAGGVMALIAGNHAGEIKANTGASY